MKKIVLILLAMVYAASPYDFLPDFLIGWGWLDDLLISYLLYRYVLFPVTGKAFDPGARPRQGRPDGGTGDGGPTGPDRPQGRAHERTDPYVVLGLDRSASKDEIRAAYKDLANRYHPDKVQHLGEEFRVLAEERFKEIRQAYTALMER